MTLSVSIIRPIASSATFRSVEVINGWGMYILIIAQSILYIKMEFKNPGGQIFKLKVSNIGFNEAAFTYKLTLKDQQNNLKKKHFSD